MKKYLNLAFVLAGSLFGGNMLVSNNLNAGVLSPEWTKDLVICEISTKNFNSTKKSETGTFNSLKTKIPYLANAGINGIWLTGHHLANSNHFYNIWTQYAVINPDKIDPSLGTKKDFKTLIDEAHKHGIKVFLDVITHGVMPESPLIKKHPKWFKGGSWGMVDYNWKAHAPNLDNWWVKMYSDYVTEFGVDGYRLDLDIHRPDLWLQIRKNAAAAGHPVVVFGENWEYGNYDLPLEGIIDFSQKAEGDITPNDSAEYDHSHPMVRNMADFANSVYNGNIPKRFFNVEVQYSDGSVAKGTTENNDKLKVIYNGIAKDKVGTEKQKPDGKKDIELIVKGINPTQTIKNVVVTDRMGTWQMLGNGNWFASVKKSGTRLKIYIAEYRRNTGSIPGFVPGFVLANISMHDVGWESFPPDKNPYVIQFSRGLFGYSALFSPLIPLFFAGEEFGAEFRPANNLASSCYKAKNVGKGRWLYGSWLDWSQLNKPEHKSMLKDVTKMLTIRKQEKDLLYGRQRHEKINILPVDFKTNIDVPAPYILWNEDKAILVAANYNTKSDAKLVMDIPVAKMKFGNGKKFILENLWNGNKKIVSAKELNKYSCVIKADKQPGGGIGIWKICPHRPSL